MEQLHEKLEFVNHLFRYFSSKRVRGAKTI